MQPEVPLSMSTETRQATSNRQRPANEQQAEEVRLRPGRRSDSACDSPSQSSTKEITEPVEGSGSQAAVGNHRLSAFHPSAPQLPAAPRRTSAGESTGFLAVPSGHTDDGLGEGFLEAPKTSQAASHGLDDAAQQAGPGPAGSHTPRYSLSGLCKNERITVATTITQLRISDAHSMCTQQSVVVLLQACCLARSGGCVRKNGGVGGGGGGGGGGACKKV